MECEHREPCLAPVTLWKERLGTLQKAWLQQIENQHVQGSYRSTGTEPKQTHGFGADWAAPRWPQNNWRWDAKRAGTWELTDLTFRQSVFWVCEPDCHCPWRPVSQIQSVPFVAETNAKAARCSKMEWRIEGKWTIRPHRQGFHFGVRLVCHLCLMLLIYCTSVGCPRRSTQKTLIGFRWFGLHMGFRSRISQTHLRSFACMSKRGMSKCSLPPLDDLIFLRFQMETSWVRPTVLLSVSGLWNFWMDWKEFWHVFLLFSFLKVFSTWDWFKVKHFSRFGPWRTQHIRLTLNRKNGRCKVVRITDSLDLRLGTGLLLASCWVTILFGPSSEQTQPFPDQGRSN